MLELARKVDPPKGCSRWLYRLPIRLYQVGWGKLLGGRMVMISHTGRVTGMTRQVVLEVVKSEASKGIFYVVAAWGEQADWFKNIQANPVVHYQLGKRSFSGRAEVLSQLDASLVFIEYGSAHPLMLQWLMRFVGYRIERNEKSFRALAEHLPVVKLVPDQAMGCR